MGCRSQPVRATPLVFHTGFPDRSLVETTWRNLASSLACHWLLIGTLELVSRCERTSLVPPVFVLQFAHFKVKRKTEVLWLSRLTDAHARSMAERKHCEGVFHAPSCALFSHPALRKELVCSLEIFLVTKQQVRVDFDLSLKRNRSISSSNFKRRVRLGHSLHSPPS